MRTLEMSSQPQTNSSNECGNSTNQYAAERARLLFGCYRKGEANDPETYAAAIAAVLADYQPETIRYVTDPRTGIASKTTFMPNPGEIKKACEDYEGPMRRAMAQEAAERRQLAERKRLMPPEGPKKTYEELVADCRARGLMIGGKSAPVVQPLDDWLEQMGISREQFDAVPDAK
jgi:hypothetical protein